MRYLIEDNDVSQCEFVTLDTVEGMKQRLYWLHKEWSKTAGENVLTEEFARFERGLWKTIENIEKGYLGKGDDVSFAYDGMAIHISITEDAGKPNGTRTR
jgi:hypothetical protein